jgi:chromosomal replication initiator protein
LLFHKGLLTADRHGAAMHRTPLTFARFVPSPENHSALLAAQDLAEALCSRQAHDDAPLLLLHGPAGTGKTHLASALVGQVTHGRPDLAVTYAQAGDLVDEGWEAEAQASDLLVVEDLQHLPSRSAEALVQLLDDHQAHGLPTVLTANVGPRQLGSRGRRFPARLSSRLAAGLVVRLEPLGPVGRRALLEVEARRQRLTIAPDVLDWLAAHLLGGGRYLLGAVTQLETLARLRRDPLDLAVVRAHFHGLATTVTVEQIAQRVGGYFQVDPEQMLSRRRSSNILVPRQVGMYLARQLTALSLGQIGAYFGGRDHTTVLHACRKVEQALTSDADLSGAVRQLHADLV